MAKVKISTKIYDKFSGTTFEPSGEFVEVDERFAERIKEIQKADARHKDSFTFKAKGKAKEDNPLE